MEHNLFRLRHDFHLATNTKIPHTFVMSTNLPNQLESTLKQHFGFGEFRLGQRDVIQDLLDGHDTLIVMPTGSGKSLCYQLSALMLEGVTIIISPLISLMQDQVDSLQRQGIPATCINSSIGARANADRIVGLRTGQYKMVYVAPERFRSGGFIDALNDIQVSLVAIDEAHCISQWGHDFRPDYLRIKRVLQSLPDARIMALTATATPAVRDDIVKQLDLEDNLIDPAAALFADAETAHERGQGFVSRFRRRVHKALGVHQRFAGIGDLDTVVENLHGGTGAGHKEVLVNQSIGH